jgi:FkbH-like protein
VIWDLDETFWHGTLTEGGVTQYRQDNHDLVIELARRGIMSSICSKNNFSAVRTILEDSGLWEYFVFPSINWEAKGGRVAQIIEKMQLRASTVLFIDDHPANVAQAIDQNPGLQVADANILTKSLLDDKRFQGKDDSGLTRLAQYKILERKHLDQTDSKGDTVKFLRNSEIVVSIENDISGNIDRAIELINRTNQLNFTKLRLPDDIDAARLALAAELGKFDTVAGLVRVSDRYGDYGYCGFYLMTGHWGHRSLVHYCFSCRVLGMGVEHWLYDRIGRPTVRVVPEVLSNLKDEIKVDWIATGSAHQQREGRSSFGDSISPEEIRLRGGCDLEILSDYFRLDTNRILTELVRWKDNHVIRFDTSSLLVLGLTKYSPEKTKSLACLGLTRNEIQSELFAPTSNRALLILSITGDCIAPVYRHKLEGFEVPIYLNGFTTDDITSANAKRIDEICVRHNITNERRSKFEDAVLTIQREYEFIGLLPEEQIKSNLKKIFERVPEGVKCFILMPDDKIINGDGHQQVEPGRNRIRRAISAVSADFSKITVIDLNEFVDAKGAMPGVIGHYDRAVYLKVRQSIKAALGYSESDENIRGI